jgi:hypothetical protein
MFGKYVNSGTLILYLILDTPVALLLTMENKFVDKRFDADASLAIGGEGERRLGDRVYSNNRVHECVRSAFVASSAQCEKRLCDPSG